MHYRGNVNEFESINKELQVLFESVDCSKTQVIISQDIFDEELFNIDLLPVAKDYPVRFIQEKLECYAILAGDSGNDISLLENVDNSLSIVVGGAKEELLKVMRKLKKESNKDSNKDSDMNSSKRVIIESSVNRKGPQSLQRIARLLKLFSRKI